MDSVSHMHLDRDYHYAGDPDWELLADRMGREALLRRIAEQNRQACSRVQVMRFINKELIKHAAELAFLLTGLAGAGRENFRDIQIRENTLKLDRLPPGIDGLRILQLSDLHLDLVPDLAAVIAGRVEGLEYDLAVITGDYRNLNHGDYTLAMESMQRVVEFITTDCYGILGNHDDLEMVMDLEAMGLRMLLNESAEISLKGETFWLCGIDDPHHYQTDDIYRALKGVPADAFKVLLSHSPETYDIAARSGFDFFLCGHTHGGQICLPGGKPVITRSDSPQWCARGNWQWQGMLGYTTTGTGGCGAALRLNCPPEIVIHELRSSQTVR